MANMTERGILDDLDWEDLIESIKNGKCTPFIGAGACYGILPLANEIAKQWAKEYHYPLHDSHDLTKVAQFLAFRRYEMFPKNKIQEIFQKATPPNFSDPHEPHGTLADLELPVYITTNYDSFMVKALESHGKKPIRDFCRWNNLQQVIAEKSPLQDPEFEPTKEEPVVYHLHGHIQIPQSIVLTESDYFDFVARLSIDASDLIPPQIQIALAGSSLLFIGYRLADWNFLVLFRRLLSSVEGSRFFTIAAQLLPEGLGDTEKNEAQKYLDTYFEKIQRGSKFKVYWGTARNFCRELRERLNKYK